MTCGTDNDAACMAFLAFDPQPCAVFNAQGQWLLSNAALLQLAADETALRQCLPVNAGPLMQACLRQQRAITEVEVDSGQRIWLWSFIPDLVQQRVLARCRDDTVQRLQARGAARAQRLYRLITENTTDLISRHRPDGRFLDASPASWTLLGYWPQELQGMPVQALLARHDRPLLPTCFDALTQEGYHTMICRLRHRDGRLLWFETASRAIRETYTGEVVEVVCISREITARVLIEENRRRLAEVVEANTDLVFFIDSQGALSYLNPAARKALGITAQMPVPRLEQLLLTADLQRLTDEGKTAALKEGVWSCELHLQRLPAAPLSVSLVLLAHRSASGERYFSVVARDISERELREAQQRRHQDELAHTTRLISLGELASGIAHELNQPLAAVVNYASASQRYLQHLATNPQAAERVGQGLSRITEQAEHAAQVIKRLRSFLRKGQRRMQLLSVLEVAREAWRLCQWQAQQKQVQLLEQMPEDLAPVYADRILLEQVLLNVLRNAIEANAEAHPHRASQIELRATQDAGVLCLQIQDQGCGVTADALAQMFTPFYTSKAEGLGLGLSMSRSIIEGFGGALEARQLGTAGLTMECRLPIART